MAAAGEQLIRVVCPFDHTIERFERSKTIICAQKGEFISRDFPRDRLWGYCCACQTFSELSTTNDGEVADKCPACERTVKREAACLCDACEVLTLQTLERPRDRPNKVFTVASGETARPACPGCLKAFDSAAAPHSCERADIVFASGRQECPFCSRPIARSRNDQAAPQPEATVVAPDVAVQTAPPSVEPRDVGGAVTGGSPTPGEAESKAEARDPQPRRGRKFLPRTRKQWATTAGLALGAVGVLLALVPPPVLAWYCHKYAVHRAPSVEPIRYSRREVLESEKIQLEVPVNDHDRQPVRCRWSTTRGHLDENNCAATLDTSGISPQAVPIPIKVSVEVTDSYDASATSEAEVYVLPVVLVNKPPVLEAIRLGMQEARSGEEVSLVANVRNPDRDTLTYTWNSSSGQITSDGNTAVLHTSSISAQSVTPVVVTLQVDDGRGGAVAGNVTVNVLPKEAPGVPKVEAPPSPAQTNQPPRLHSLQPQKSTVLAGESVAIDAVATDEDEDRLDYVWEPADRITGHGPSITLNTLVSDVQREVKPIQVRLTIFDRRGGSSSQLVFIYVLPPRNPEGPAPKGTPPAEASDSNGAAGATRPF